MRDELISLLHEAFETGIITSTMQSQIDAVKKSLKLSEAEYQQIEDEIRIDTYIRKVKERERKGVTFMGDLRKQYKITEDDKLIIQEKFNAEPKKPAPNSPEIPKQFVPPVKKAEAPKPPEPPKQSGVMNRSDKLKQHVPGLPKEEEPLPAPAKKAEAPKRPVPVEKPSPVYDDPTGPLILVADDNETQLFLTRKTLEENNYQCVTADSPEIAVRIIAEKQPALVLCDINFGIGRPTGMDVFTNTRAKKFTMPFILVSAFIQKEFMDHAKRIGVTEYITKPTEPEELIAVVKKYLH
ncbi:MAG: response regulator [Bacteriovoracaceae bacterium]|nr:response regulator [Bacteroidota bacterium]